MQEYFDSDMSRIIKNSASLSMTEEHIKTIIYNILCGINFIHSAQVVHRDIKPANILINSECNVRICDFGLARTLAKHEPVQDIEQDREPIEKLDL